MLIKNLALCVLGTLGFCVLLNAPKNKIIIMVFGAGISAFTFEVLYSYFELNDFYSTFISVLIIELYSEVCARIFKTPAIIILLPSTIPLLPGSYLYYAMSCLINGNISLFNHYAKQTMLVAFGLAIGAVVSLVVLNVVRKIKHCFTT